MSVNGRTIPNTPLAVDFWQVRRCHGTRLFFLSHMHSDHTVGLTSTWTNRPIYCSPVTRSLLTLKLQVKEEWIHPLELGEPHLLPLDDIGKEKLTVTLIDANHCPGAVMFLFEGYFGTILYTGDFRYAPVMLRELYQKTSGTIDVLYLDNTNCDPNRSLPSRKQATQLIKEIIRSHSEHCIVVGLYTLGKESLLVDLAMEFKTWIEVSYERMEILKALDLPDVFTTERGAGRIRVVNHSEVSAANVRLWEQEQPTLAILPTSRHLPSFHPNVHVVPYSDHSSYQELEDFVSALKPTTLVPILGVGVPESLLSFVPSGKPHEFLVPESVRQYMSSQRDPSATATSVSRKHSRPLPPKGVIFESPLGSARKRRRHSSGAESLQTEDSGTDCSEKDSTLVLDLSRTLVHELDLEQSSCSPDDESVVSVSCSLSPSSSSVARVVTSPARGSGSSASPHSSESRNANSPTLSDSTGTCRPSPLHLQAQNRPASSSRPSSRDLLLRVEQIENELLKNLPFTEDDLRCPFHDVLKTQRP
ncbi:5' exonuclease Apollo [Synchiropus splendidus]|uniref:5' exonuclease Apollo n=1 Tax=Synchiropus splendidus TaxID=270530 RepID=UPI00237DAA76|nr:5' exonuclease Apollo [Synchiropus splendidus]